MRVLITGAGGYVGGPVLDKLLENEEVSYVIAIDGLDTVPTFSNDSTKQWVQADLDKVTSSWWNSLIELNQIDTIYYLESYENDNLAVLNDGQVNRYQQSDFFFVEFLQNRIILEDTRILDVLYLSTDRVYYEDDFPNELHPLTIQTTVSQTEPIPFERETRQYFYSYAAVKATTEIKLHPVSNVNLRIIRPFAITGPERNIDCPLLTLVNKAINSLEIQVYEEGVQGVAFTHLTDLVNLITSDFIFDEDIGYTLTSNVINASRVQNYVSVRQLVDKILNKTESDSILTLTSGMNSFSEIMFTPQIRNQVRIEEPQIPLEIILDEVIDSLGYGNVYAPLEMEPPIIVNDSIGLSGKAEPEAVMTFFFGNGEKANVDIDDMGYFDTSYTFEYPIDVYPIEVRITTKHNVQYTSAIITA